MANLTWKDIEDKLEYEGFNVSSRETNGDLYEIEISKYYNSNEEVFTLQCEKNNPASVIDAVNIIYENYDVDYETYIWLGKDGHGANGAPYHIKDILDDKQLVEDSLYELKYKLDWYVQNADRKYSVKEIGKQFLQIFADRRFGENFDGDFLYATKETVEEILSINRGTIQHKKDVINKYLLSIGIDDNEPSTYKNAIKKAIKKRNQTMKSKQSKNIECDRGI